MDLRKVTIDFRDGNGPIDVYHCDRTLNEQIAIEAAVRYDEHGNVVNNSEVVLESFMQLAKDSSGMRMFMTPEDRARVRATFKPGPLSRAVLAFDSAEAAAGN